MIGSRPARQPPGRRPAARPAGRQGDPGGSVFFVSLEDDLVVQHAGTRSRLAEDATDGARRGRAGGLGRRARPAGRRGREPRDPPQHLALQRGDRAAAPGAGRAPRAAAHHRRRRRAAEAIDRRRPRRSDEEPASGPAGIALYHLDRRWAEHLAELADVREGVHLRALGRLDPLDEFHRSVEVAIGGMPACAGEDPTTSWSTCPEPRTRRSIRCSPRCRCRSCRS